jgi:hypothetical protein
MRKAGWVVLGALVLAGCQGFPGAEDASAASKPVAEGTPEPSRAKVISKPPQVPSTVIETTVVVSPVFSSMQTDAVAVSAGIVIPPLAANDSRQSAFSAEKSQVDQLLAQGTITREAGAKRLYRFAVKEGISKGKPDEDFWQALIQTYRNLDDRYITVEGAAGDINAAAIRRAAAGH